MLRLQGFCGTVSSKHNTAYDSVVASKRQSYGYVIVQPSRLDSFPLHSGNQVFRLVDQVIGLVEAQGSAERQLVVSTPCINAKAPIQTDYTQAPTVDTRNEIIYTTLPI